VFATIINSLIDV